MKNNNDQNNFNFLNFQVTKPIYYYKNGNTRVTKNELTSMNIALHRFRKTLKFVQKQQQLNLEFSKKITEIRNKSKSQLNFICNIEEKKDDVTNEIIKELQELKSMMSKEKKDDVTNEIIKELQELKSMMSKMFKSKQ